MKHQKITNHDLKKKNNNNQRIKLVNDMVLHHTIPAKKKDYIDFFMHENNTCQVFTEKNSVKFQKK